ncbi:MAG: hypothetical protein HZA79_05025 [Sphingobacteriales bacterium]|nr:hypothetical protein [Sphingobacteriales bacterium]
MSTANETANKADLLKKAVKLGIDIDERRTTPEQLQTLIENVENGLQNYYFEDEAHTGESKNEIFQEVRVLREAISKKGNKLVTPFTIIDIVRKRVIISAREVACINNGRITEPANKVFTLYLRPGTKKVDDLERDISK